jgi:hypothetical protein
LRRSRSTKSLGRRWLRTRSRMRDHVLTDAVLAAASGPHPSMSTYRHLLPMGEGLPNYAAHTRTISDFPPQVNRMSSAAARPGDTPMTTTFTLAARRPFGHDGRRGVRARSMRQVHHLSRQERVRYEQRRSRRSAASSGTFSPGPASCGHVFRARRPLTKPTRLAWLQAAR